MTKNIIIGIVLVVIGLAIGSYFLGGSRNESLGATIGSGDTRTNPMWLYGGASIGVSGQLISNVLFGTCDFSIGATTQAIGTSTGSRSCAVTGVKAGDTVFVQPSNTNTTNWNVVGSLASSTNGYLEMKFVNQSSTTTIPTTFTTGVKYIIVR